jgi:hypothetical protein
MYKPRGVNDGIKTERLPPIRAKPRLLPRMRLGTGLWAIPSAPIKYKREAANCGAERPLTATELCRDTRNGLRAVLERAKKATLNQSRDGQATAKSKPMRANASSG